LSTADRIAFIALSLIQAQGENVDFVTKLEKALRKRHHILMAEVAKIEHLIDAFEKGAKRGAKLGGSRLSAAARKKISLAQKARWAKTRKATAAKG
jgi:ABC-type protease/lipase transport system fused ATPase/permease subunit